MTRNSNCQQPAVIRSGEVSLKSEVERQLPCRSVEPGQVSIRRCSQTFNINQRLQKNAIANVRNRSES